MQRGKDVEKGPLIRGSGAFGEFGGFSNKMKLAATTAPRISLLFASPHILDPALSCEALLPLCDPRSRGSRRPLEKGMIV
jgi:hypothetical protein